MALEHSPSQPFHLFVYNFSRAVRMENFMRTFAAASIVSPSYTGPNWSTASYGDTNASQNIELAALGEHLSLCQGSNKRWSSLRYWVGSLHRFAASRFVTTLAVAALLIGATMLVL